MSELISLKPSAIQLNANATSKKQIFKALSIMAKNNLGLDEDQVFSALCERESVGSTCLGNGIALPHARLKTLVRPYSFLLQLAHPLEEDKSDWGAQNVDFVFCVLAPQAQDSMAMKQMARLARSLREPQRCAKLRNCQSEQHLIDVWDQALAPVAA